MKTLVFGASPNNYRYSNIATLRLQQSGIEVIPTGINPGTIGGQIITDLNKKTIHQDIHTITMYLNPRNQQSWYQYILDLRPNRIIFNPGSENPEFYKLLDQAGIHYQEDCTLVMLASNSYLLSGLV
ncbi:MAG: CoA-binding protein [Cyclobacteriaceae bacterium]|nr:MAG: CoA-binding protein [Cyclobacteriaceae bacterium]